MSNRFFPFHALGFRCNPFRALTDDEWAEVAVLPDSINRALQNGFAHLQILGERGFGKTTMLIALAAQFKRDGKRVQYEYIPDGQSYFKTNGDALNVFLLDEAQRLDSREQERFVRLAPQSQLILATHVDFAAVFASHHLNLATVRLGDSGNEHLRMILTRRLDFFRLDEKEIVISREQSDREISSSNDEISRRDAARNDNRIEFSPDAIAHLSATYRGNLRALEQFLYEGFQRLDHTGTITADQLNQKPGF